MGASSEPNAGPQRAPQMVLLAGNYTEGNCLRPWSRGARSRDTRRLDAYSVRKVESAVTPRRASSWAKRGCDRSRR